MRGIQLFSIDGGGSLRASLPEEHVERIDELKEERGLNTRSELVRQFVYAGWKVDQQIPLEIDTEQVGDELAGNNPYRQIFIDNIPEDKDNAVKIDEFRDKIKEKVDTEVMRVFQESENVEMTDDGIFLDR